MQQRVAVVVAGFVAAGLALALAACGGSSGDGSAAAGAGATPPGIATGAAALAASTTLTFRVDKVTTDGRPAVDFTVTNETGAGMTGLVAADLRFNIAKLVPASNGEPQHWQNYINRARDGAVQGSQERVATGFAFGTLTGLGSGRYTYTFATDIADARANPCPAPCTDASGAPLDIRYESGLVHRATIHQANAKYPIASGVLDFMPGVGPVPLQREIVAAATCDSCHNQLVAHGTRSDVRLCVTCHNPGSWVKSAVAGTPNTTVDFNVMVHRIHYNNAGAALPSVAAGFPYKIGSADFSAAAFPQDVRNCTRCHDGTPGAPNATAHGDQWKTEPSLRTCGACHDNVFFGTAPEPTRPYQTKAHSGGVMTDSSTCALCHGGGKFADSKDIAVAHSQPGRLRAAAARFRFNLIGVSAVAAGGRPVVTFSVTDPTRANAPYDIKADAAFSAGAASTLALKIGWTTRDFANDGSGQPFGQPVTINALTAAVPGAVAGTYSATSPVAIPAGQTGTLRVTMEGHPAGDVSTAGAFTDRLIVKSVFKDAAITGALLARRLVVDVAKCDVCHGALSLHGNNRSEEIGVCSVCHNANATDAGRRPASGSTDGKREESVDLKTMVHAIHAGEAGKGGFRTKGITVYGFGGSVNDFSDVVYPGKLADCASCHVGTSYQIDGAWLTPTSSGILGTTVDSAASPTDAADNLRISPTAAVCASCHDGPVARLHMQDVSSGGNFSATQATLNGSVVEGCSLCHGAGRVFDVQTVHGVR